MLDSVAYAASGRVRESLLRETPRCFEARRTEPDSASRPVPEFETETETEVEPETETEVEPESDPTTESQVKPLAVAFAELLAEPLTPLQENSAKPLTDPIASKRTQLALSLITLCRPVVFGYAFHGHRETGKAR